MTLSELAKLAGVSVSTASKAFREAKDISEETREHIFRIARENGCYNVTLNVWSCNPNAMKFYEKLGMKPQKTYMERVL